MANPGFALGVMVREVNRLSLEERLERIHGMGFECAQLNMNVLGMDTVPGELPPGKAGEIGATFWAFGLTLAAVSGTFNTAHPDETVRKAGIAGIQLLCEAAEDMDTQIITLSTGTRNAEDMWKHHPDNDSHEAWVVMLDTFRQLAKIAEKYDVTLAFESEVTNIVNTAEKAARLLDETGSDHLKVVMDPANFLFPNDLPRQLEIFEDAFSRLGEHIVLAHAKDLGDYDAETEKLSRVPVGKGKLDYPGYIKLLKQSGYQGPIIIHHLKEEEMPGCRDFIRDLLVKV